MAHRNKVPCQPQDKQEVRELVNTLTANSKKGGGRGKNSVSVKKSTFQISNGRTVDSWRMQDWDYKKPFLPTYARGLFTYKTLKGHDEIAVRGYDKFFNHGEVSKTKWENVEKNTRGPYELSVKENGCIIFISGLDDNTLLVCSKHSTGVRTDVEKSHAVAGEEWVDRHLKSVGKTREQLAKALRDMNATAVGELCDDAFEEHVLAYNPETAGIYLHGINLNLPEFATYPGHLVDKFAEDWGFRKTMYLMMDDIKEVKKFLDKVAETGAYEGRDTEGFVIRCQARDAEDAPWHDWFFKYKFEEPYLMYRQWRECTKAMINGKAPLYKKHQRITKDYLDFARRRFVENPRLMKEYNNNHGIIALRESFLNDKGLKGSDIIRREIEAGEEGPEVKDVVRDVIIMPAATIGCGKTTIAYALTKLFDWGHCQNDNVQGKGNRAQRFVAAITSAMLVYPVVIADRNNHQKREREQLINDIAKIAPQTKFVCLHFVHEKQNYVEIRQIMRERVLGRGDNHQTIQAGSKAPEEIIEIMEGFLRRFQPVDPSENPDNGFDLVIDLDVTKSSRENLETVISKLSSEFPKLFQDMPTADDLDKAIEAALNEYNPDIKHDLGKKSGKDKHINLADRATKDSKRQKQNGKDEQTIPFKPAKLPKLEFFAVRLSEQRVSAILENVFKEQPAGITKFYKQIKGSRRIQSEFHVTLMHRASASQNPDLWETFKVKHTIKFEGAVQQIVEAGKIPIPGPEPELGTCKVQLERVVWDSRVMTIVVRLLDEAKEGWETANNVAHITIGTASKEIKPKESNDLLQRWLKDGTGEETGIHDLVIKGSVLLEGSVRGVLQKF